MRIKDLNIGHRGKTLVSGISFETEPGEFILLCGPNGSGKSTLLRALAGKDAIMVPTGVPKVKGFTLREFIATTLYSESDWRGRISPAMASDISKSLECLGISSLADRDISTLSDGEFQKGCIASALSRHAKTLLLDEPTSFLDVDNKSLILQALRDIA
ncbi:MAG: ABC transporter ATP-binding protein, partial [Bacteroidales bacterium]|nr:ABC transporter ATP-binding protein [Bacteroidales bacterium]